MPDCRPDNFADHLVDEKVAISEYSLSASVACGKVRRCAVSLSALERLSDGVPPSQFCCATEDLFGVL